MSDIVERLREPPEGPGALYLMIEAADEIERLRLNVVGLTASDEAKYDIIQALHAQIEQLRSALK